MAAATVSSPRPLGLANTVVYRAIAINADGAISSVTTAPTLTAGSGVPSGTEPQGSIYMRTDAAADAGVYQNTDGATTWVVLESAAGSLDIPSGSALTLATADIVLTADGTNCVITGTGDVIIGTAVDFNGAGAITATGNPAINFGTGAAAFGGAASTLDGVSGGTLRKIGGQIDIDVAAGASLTGSAVETVLTSTSIPANMIKQGTHLRVKFMARVTADNAATTLIVRLRLGPTTLTGTALVTSSTVDTASGDVIVGEFNLVGRAAPGAAAACVGMGWLQDLAAPPAATESITFDSANFATNGALLLELTGIWSAGDANAVQSEIWIVDINA